MNPWERQAGEGSKAFRAFAAYRDLGPTRSVTKVVEKLKPDCPHRKMLEQWCTKWGWVSRAQAWDDEKDRIFLLETKAAIAEMNQRHSAVAVAMMVRVAERLKAMPANELSVRDIAQWLKVAADVERVARGEPSEIVDVNNRNASALMLPETLPPEVYQRLVDEMRKAGRLPGASG